MKILVCGGRDFHDKEFLFRTLDGYRERLGDFRLITGAQRKWNAKERRWEGADYWAEEWARARCLWYSGLAADWSAGRGGGPRRNSRMRDEAKPNRVVAFKGGDGTKGMCALAEEVGIPVDRIGWAA